MGEDKEEEETKGAEGEEVEEAPTPTELKKRKVKTQPMPRTKKIVKQSQPKPTTPTTRASTRASTEKAKEKIKQTKQGGQEKKRPRRKYLTQPDFEEEKTESNDNNQFKVASHNPLLGLEILCN